MSYELIKALEEAVANLVADNAALRARVGALEGCAVLGDEAHAKAREYAQLRWPHVSGYDELARCLLDFVDMCESERHARALELQTRRDTPARDV